MVDERIFGLFRSSGTKCQGVSNFFPEHRPVRVAGKYGLLGTNRIAIEEVGWVFHRVNRSSCLPYTRMGLKKKLNSIIDNRNWESDEREYNRYYY